MKEILWKITFNFHINYPILVGGWAYPSEKYDFVSWDHEIPNWMEA